MSEKQGVCSKCDLYQPIRQVDIHDIPGKGRFTLEMNSPARYVMDEHDAFGDRCDGGGTKPESVVDKPVSEEESFVNRIRDELDDSNFYFQS